MPLFITDLLRLFLYQAFLKAEATSFSNSFGAVIQIWPQQHHGSKEDFQRLFFFQGNVCQDG